MWVVNQALTEISFTFVASTPLLFYQWLLKLCGFIFLFFWFTKLWDWKKGLGVFSLEYQIHLYSLFIAWLHVHTHWVVLLMKLAADCNSLRSLRFYREQKRWGLHLPSIICSVPGTIFLIFIFFQICCVLRIYCRCLHISVAFVFHVYFYAVPEFV